MKVAIPKETLEGENRVALVPSLVSELKKIGAEILLQKEAGYSANFPDSAYQDTTIIDDQKTLFSQANMVLCVNPPPLEAIEFMQPGTLLIGLLNPYANFEFIKKLQERQITSFAMEFIPRISRAQSMDALSSQATVAGYKAALIGANLHQRFFPMLTTAAGTIRPTQVLILGAGVAGLQAIATAKRLGAIVKAYDIRPAAREQIESLGAKMIDIGLQAEGHGGYARELTDDEKKLQQQALEQAICEAEVVITTALIPGKPAPRMITQKMVEKMQNGSVIVDLAASNGGNCELTQPNATITHQGVCISGFTNLPSMVAKDASNMYAKNLIQFVHLLVQEQKIALNFDDEILAQSLITFDGVLKNSLIQTLMKG